MIINITGISYRLITLTSLPALSIGVYMSKPTATKLNFYEASSDGVVFPTVTICNFNKFNKSYFDTDDMSTKKGQLKDFLKITTPIWGHKQVFDSDSWDSKYDKVSWGSCCLIGIPCHHSLSIEPRCVIFFHPLLFVPKVQKSQRDG